VKRSIYLILCICLWLPEKGFALSGFFPVKESGITGDGKQIETQRLQQVIDSCHLSGGGTVFFPAGDYLSATLQLKDNVTLYLSAGARLIASDRKELYTIRTNLSDTGSESTPMLIYAQGAKNIAIKGEGELVAQPQYYQTPLGESDFIRDDIQAAKESGVELLGWRWKEPAVTLVFLSECQDVSITGVQLKHSVFWTLHIHWCERVNMQGIYIYSDLEKAANADGIDIDGCRNVTISDCIIETADDAICMKTTNGTSGYRDCENITVTNCVLTSTSCALKLGTESYGDFRYIHFTNCIIRNTNRGLGIFIRDGGTAEHILFSNIRMECTRKPVGWWGSADAMRFVVLKRNPDSRIGGIRNIWVKDVYAHVEGTSIIAGYEGMKNISDIILENVTIDMFPETVSDQRAREGILLQNSERLTFHQVSLTWKDREKPNKWTYPFYLQDVSEVTFNRIKPGQTSPDYTPFCLENSDHITITQSHFETSPSTLYTPKGDLQNIEIESTNKYIPR